MDKCFLCGKPALKMVEIEVGSSSTSIDHHDHRPRPHGHLAHTHRDRATTTHYALKPLCADCIQQREAEALETAKALGNAAELVVGGMGVGLKLLALFGCLGPLVLAAIGGAFYFFARH